MPGIAFDWAVEFYDRTRGYPECVAERIASAIVAHTRPGPGSRFLELGIGTGRVALPFLQAGYHYSGIDLSRPMMEELKRKVERAPAKNERGPGLVQADAVRLPVAEGSFDVVIVVHVLHLVDEWQETLAEARRALRKPGGWLLLGRDDIVGKEEPFEVRRVNEQWDAILGSLGAARDGRRSRPSERLHEHDETALRDYLDRLGGHPQTLTLLEYPGRPVSPRSVAQYHVDRLSSSDWLLPDDVHAEAARRLLEWLDRECTDPEAEIGSTFEFRATIARW